MSSVPLPIRGFFLILVFTFSTLHFSLATDVVEIFLKNGKFGIRDAEGNTLITPQYEKIGWSNGLQLPVGDVIGYNDGNGWGLMTIKGKHISDSRYYTLEGVHKGLIFASVIGRFSNELLYGVLNFKGDVQVDFKYHSIQKSGELLIVSNRTGQGSYFGLINSYGKEVLPSKYSLVENFNNNVYTYTIASGKKGLIDTDGRVLIEPLLNSIEPLESGKAVIQEGGSYGIIDVKGKITVPPRFKSIGEDRVSFQKYLLKGWKNTIVEFEADSVLPASESMVAVFRNAVLRFENLDTVVNEFSSVKRYEKNEDLIVVETESTINVLDGKGNILVGGDLENVMLDEYYIYTQQSGKWSIYDHLGKLISKWALADVKVSNDPLVPVKKGKYWGYMNQDGNLKISAKFDDAEPFKEKVAIVNYLGFAMMINRKGDIIIDRNADKMSFQSGGYILAKSNQRTDIFSPEGFRVYQTYNELVPAFNGYLEVTESGQYGYVTLGGNEALLPIYDTIRYLGGRFLEITQEDKVGLARLDGVILIQPSTRYQQIRDVNEGKISVKINNSWGFVNLQEQLLIANRYDNVFSFNNGMAIVSMNGSWGMIDTQERIIVQPNIDKIMPCEKGTIIIQRDGKQGVLTDQGKMIIEPVHDEIVRCMDGALIVRDGEKFGVFLATGEQVMPISFDSVIQTMNHSFIAKRRGKYALINTEGNFELHLKYNQITEYSDGFYLCQLAGK
ncbi:WG repeat-containing protein [Reichenbachiella versicolor]|uniref:WG repeat-containing protein n=1 Tax=Reichenbachiella versicolor TaxID=1821036 RepID=UPI000D6E9D56|nr:WG repeat-containing protein [Reichenbachiella versicolor]